MPDNDPINMVSGSTGLLGAVDTILVLEKENRTENKARLYITGRQVKYKVLGLEFDEDNNIWNFTGYAKEHNTKIDMVIEGILDVLKFKNRFKDTATELVEHIKHNNLSFDISPNAMSRLLNENSISLRKSYGIYYKRERNASKR